MTAKNPFTKLKRKKRLATVCFILAAFFIVLVGRLFFVAIFMTHGSKNLKDIEVIQSTNDIVINAKRGNVLDRNNNELATSADLYRVDLDLVALKQTLKDKKITNAEFSSKMASILNMKAEDVDKALNSTLSNGLPSSWASLKRKVEKTSADKVKNLKLFGILVSSDSERYYPNHNFLSQVIGHIDDKGSGVTGVEYSYNKELSGEQGRLIYQRDNKSNQLYYEDSRYSKPSDGKSVVLTIDTAIQNYAEIAAEKALADNKAKGVSIMVMNPKNGEILAMVSKPDYDLSNPQAGAKDTNGLVNMWKNRSVSTIFEPGSIFKVITAAAAMEYRTSKENDTFICNGSLKVSNRTINCWTSAGHGKENFVDILKNSCNVGFMEVGQKLGKENLYNFATKLGFGKKTGIDLPGEEAGIIKSPDNMSDVDLATESFGQSISVTQVQYMAAFNAVANGGTWIKPHVMKSIVHTDGNGKLIVDRNFADYAKKQVLEKSLTDTLRGYLEKVVSEGVGKSAYIEEYHIGGKTGTAQKAVNGVYEQNRYMSSFAGLAPYDDPKITLLVTVDEPDASNYYAGSTAAPVAKELFSNIFNYITVNPNVLK